MEEGGQEGAGVLLQDTTCPAHCWGIAVGDGQRALQCPHYCSGNYVARDGWTVAIAMLDWMDELTSRIQLGVLA